MTKPYLSPVGFRFFAHRGLTLDANSQALDENCEPALARALQVGATYLEVDVRASRDGVAVVCHDADLTRIAANPAKLANVDWAGLKVVLLNNSAKLLSLEELFARFPDARVNIDIKSADAIEPTAVAVQRAGAIERVLISSFSERRRAAAVKLLPGVATSSSALQLLKLWLAHQLRAEALFGRTLQGLDALQIPVARGPMRFDSESFIRAVRQHGVEVHYWTVNDIHQAKALRARGANGIVSDRIDLMVAALAE